MVPSMRWCPLLATCNFLLTNYGVWQVKCSNQSTSWWCLQTNFNWGAPQQLASRGHWKLCISCWWIWVVDETFLHRIYAIQQYYIVKSKVWLDNAVQNAVVLTKIWIKPNVGVLKTEQNRLALGLLSHLEAWYGRWYRGQQEGQQTHRVYWGQHGFQGNIVLPPLFWMDTHFWISTGFLQNGFHIKTWMI